MFLYGYIYVCMYALAEDSDLGKTSKQFTLRGHFNLKELEEGRVRGLSIWESD
jgi:hypothetical protein